MGAPTPPPNGLGSIGRTRAGKLSTETPNSGGIAALAERECPLIAAANAGDHALVHRLLLAVYQRPSREEFFASLDDPYYEPSDRLLVRRGDEIVSHVLLNKRLMSFGAVQLPLAEVQWLATLPEYRSAGYARRLLSVADDQMRNDGAVVALLQTRQPELFLSAGWALAARRRYLRVSVGNLLSEFTAGHRPPALGPVEAQRRISTRMWRHVELRSLMRLYEQNTADKHGPLIRSEEYWRWLISRQAYGQIIVAVEGEDCFEFGEQAPKLVGYAVTKGKQIVEMMTDGDPNVAAQLVVRAAREAIERDIDALEVSALPGSPLDQLLTASGAVPKIGGRADEVIMLKILDPSELVRRLYPELHDRAKAAGIDRPVELSLEVDGAPQRFVLTRRSARVDSGAADRADVVATASQFAQLLLGCYDPDVHAAEGLTYRNKRVAKIVRALLPPIPFWRPRLDDLQA
jgi:GNAT superfamily N-acetyltransferase